MSTLGNASNEAFSVRPEQEGAGKAQIATTMVFINMELSG